MKNVQFRAHTQRRFRETLWFKAGASESERCDRALEEIRAGRRPEPNRYYDLMIDESYHDEASITDVDRLAFSLEIL